jgi:hypothetical protein
LDFEIGTAGNKRVTKLLLLLLCCCFATFSLDLCVASAAVAASGAGSQPREDAGSW